MQAGKPERLHGPALGRGQSRVRRARPRARSSSPGITRAVIRERDRAPLEGTLPGDGYRLMVEILTERGSRARIETWRLDIRRVPTDTSEDEWRIAGQQPLTTVDGLYRLVAQPGEGVPRAQSRGRVRRPGDPPRRRVRVRRRHARGPDGRGAARRRRRHDVRSARARDRARAGAHLRRERQRSRRASTRCSCASTRSDFATRLAGRQPDRGAAPDPVMFRRADAFFREDVGKSYSLDLADLSRETWSLPPAPGDLLAEIHTRRFQTLTYTKSANDPEDISLFDRRRRRNISVYPSAAHLAAGVSRFDEDARAALRRDALRARRVVRPGPAVARRPRAAAPARHGADAINNLTLRLAENAHRPVDLQQRVRPAALAPRSAARTTSSSTCNGYATRGTEITLVIAYSGRLEPAEPDRESVAPQFPQDQPQVQSRARRFRASRACSTRRARTGIPRGRPATTPRPTMHLTVPEPYQRRGERRTGARVARGGARRTTGSRPARRYTFEAAAAGPLPLVPDQPAHPRRRRARSRWWSRSAGLASAGGGALPADAAAGRLVQQRARALRRGQPAPDRRAAARPAPVAADIMLRTTRRSSATRPYPDLTLALIEKDLPGGHSPAYLAVLYQPLPTSPSTGRTTRRRSRVPRVLHRPRGGPPVVGTGRRLAHLSRPVDQRGLRAVLRRALRAQAPRRRALRRHAAAHGEVGARRRAKAGPVSLGYRLGHIQGDSRIFRAIVYNKSAVVLHMLRRMVGDEAFFRGVRRLYFGSRFAQGRHRRCAGGVREGERPGRCERFFDAWIDGSGTPQVACLVGAGGRRRGRRRSRCASSSAARTVEFPVTVDARATRTARPRTRRSSSASGRPSSVCRSRAT